MSVAPILIGVDWGATNLRAFCFNSDGSVTDTRRAACGMSRIADGAFESALAEVIEDWLVGAGAPILMSGMIGARQGWREAGYTRCPADVAALASALTPVRSRLGDAWIVPGICADLDNGLTDVMRGEETQIAGAIDAQTNAILVAPGTHSKWADIEAGRVMRFRTFMTGEVFSLLRAYSLLGAMMEGDAADDDTFDLGVRRGRESTALLHLLFSARTEALFKRINPKSLSSYLSGLLIGSEIADGLSYRTHAHLPFLVVGACNLSRLYHRALIASGASDVHMLDGEAVVARGLWRIWQGRQSC